MFVCGGVVGVVCCLRTQECALFNRFRHSMFVCCVVMMCIGETGCCDSALVPPLFFGGGCWCAGLIPYMFFDLIEVMFLVWSCSSEKFCCGVCWLGHSCGAQSMGCVGVPGVLCPDCFLFCQ